METTIVKEICPKQMYDLFFFCGGGSRCGFRFVWGSLWIDLCQDRQNSVETLSNGAMTTRNGQFSVRQKDETRLLFNLLLVAIWSLPGANFGNHSLHESMMAHLRLLNFAESTLILFTLIGVCKKKFDMHTSIWAIMIYKKDIHNDLHAICILFQWFVWRFISVKRFGSL